jgi:hypothetical protein
VTQCTATHKRINALPPLRCATSSLAAKKAVGRRVSTVELDARHQHLTSQRCNIPPAPTTPQWYYTTSPTTPVVLHNITNYTTVVLHNITNYTTVVLHNITIRFTTIVHYNTTVNYTAVQHSTRGTHDQLKSNSLSAVVVAVVSHQQQMRVRQTTARLLSMALSTLAS